ncbi:MAG: DUF1616 domain-containing protein [Promethearchaeota archaeon]
MSPIKEDSHVPETVRQLILESLLSRRFNTVREVVRALEVSGVKQAVTLRVIQDLAREGEVILNLPGAPDDAVMAPISTLGEYLQCRLSLDLWITLLLLVLGVATTFLIPANLYPLVIIRWVFSGLFLFFIPGFAFVRSLFPFDRYVDQWERLALSIISSIGLFILVAFAFNFTPWGIRLIPIAIGVSVITLITIILATYRRVKILTRAKEQD